MGYTRPPSSEFCEFSVKKKTPFFSVNFRTLMAMGSLYSTKCSYSPPPSTIMKGLTRSVANFSEGNMTDPSAYIPPERKISGVGYFCVTLSPYSTKKRVSVGSSLRHLTHEMYMPNAKTRRQAPNATYIPLEYRLRLLPNVKKSTKKRKKCTWPTQETCVT